MEDKGNRGTVIRRDGGLGPKEDDYKPFPFGKIWKGKDRSGVVEEVVETQKAETTKEVVEQGMPDFGVLKGNVKTLTVEEIAEIKTQDAEWKAFILGTKEKDGAGTLLAKIEIAIEQIERVRKATEGLSPRLQSDLQDLEQQEKDIESQLVGNEEALGRAMFDRTLTKMGLLAEMVGNDEIELSDDKVQAFVLEGYTSGRLVKLSQDEAREARKKRESNLVSWDWTTYRVSPDNPEKKTKPNLAFVGGLRKVLNAVVAQRKRREEEQKKQKIPVDTNRIAEIKKSCSEKFTLSDFQNRGAKIPTATVILGETQASEWKDRKGKPQSISDNVLSVMLRPSRNRKHEEVALVNGVGGEIEPLIKEYGHGNLSVPERALWDPTFKLRSEGKILRDQLTLRRVCVQAIRQEEIRHTPQPKIVKPAKDKVENVDSLGTGCIL